jgi:hypothetical protein
MSLIAATRSLILMGRCVPSVKQNASKIIVKKLELDQNLLMVGYYSKYIIITITSIDLNIFVRLFSISIKMKYIMLMIQSSSVKQVMWS